MSGGAITGMGDFSLKHGKAETSVNRQAEVTSKQSGMSLKLQEGGCWRQKVGSYCMGSAQSPQGLMGFSRAVFPKEYLEIQGVIFRLHSDWGMLLPSGRK